MSGTLYLVGTPLGNIEDMSPRAKRILDEVDAILCEDTRRTGRLLNYIGVQKTLLAFHDHNEDRKLNRVIARLEQGDSLALVSDAGMPLIHDPGYPLVKRVLELNLPLTCIPGPTAPTAALVLSGFPAVPYTFWGFLPTKAAKRKTFCQTVLQSPHTQILFLSPHRGAAELADLAADAERPAMLARELTKKFETCYHASLGELATFVRDDPPKGEWTLVIGPALEQAAPDLHDLLTLVEREAKAQEKSIKQTAFEIAEQYGLPRRSLYKELLKNKDSESGGG